MSYLVLVVATQVVPERGKRKDALVSLHERAMQQFKSARIAADNSGIATLCQR